MSQPSISAVICTYNRADYLRQAIQSLIRQTLPPEEFEIVVVDNASEDDTAQVVQQGFSHLTNLKYVVEPILGLSQARNTGLQAASGQFVAYLDSDAVAGPQWLATLVDCFAHVQPMPAAVGGPVELLWEAPRPEWLPDSLLVHYGRFDWGEHARFLARGEYLAGGNCGFRRAVLEKIGGFSTDLGRRGNRLLSSEEVEVFQKLQQQDGRLYYHPAIRIDHAVPAARLQPAWCKRRSYWQGVSNAILRSHRESLSQRRCLGLGIYTARTLLGSPRNWAILWRSPNDRQQFETTCRLWEEFGYMAAMLGRCR